MEIGISGKFGIECIWVGVGQEEFHIWVMSSEIRLVVMVLNAFMEIG